MQVFITPRAGRDLDNIADWTLESWGQARMESYLRRLYLRMDTLKHNPKIGRERPDISKGLRCLTEQSHLIFYLVDNARISIVAVLHQSMDVTSKLG
jgi:toxin ParE1/3/4